MKSCSNSTIKTATVTLTVFTFFCCSLAVYGDVEFDGGVTAEIDYLVNGNVWVYNANVTLYEPAHILGAVVTGSEAVLDIYGGQIDYMLLISFENLDLPEGVVTVYGTDFAINGFPVDPDTTELYLNNDIFSGVYNNGTPFAFPVYCAVAGGGDLLYNQTVKLGWVVSEPDIEVTQTEYNLGKIDVDSMQVDVVPVFNLGNAPLTIESLQLVQGGLAQFSMAPLQELPVIIEPNTVIDLEVRFSPVIEGVDTAVLSIQNNDPKDPFVDVVLTGEGIPIILLPEDQIIQIQNSYDVATADGSIQGVGNTRSARNKVNTFGKMLTIVDELIAAGMYDSAILTLEVIESKCDGQGSPADFIQGEAAMELNAQVNELINTLHSSK